MAVFEGIGVTLVAEHLVVKFAGDGIGEDFEEVALFEIALLHG